jgi:predicted aspartyl protease
MSTEVNISQAHLASADDLFKRGMFTEAEKNYRDVFAGNPRDFRSALRLGHITLLSNRLGDASMWLTKAAELRPEDNGPKALLAEVFYRQDKFHDAAGLLHAVGKEAKAKQLESFRHISPYENDDMAESVRVKFVMTNPLPVVEVQINNSAPVNFFIDTGGAEVVIDTEFAREEGIAHFGSEIGTFAGGKQAGFEHGRVDSIRLNDVIVKNIPVSIMDVRRFSQPVFRGKRVDGIVGTVLLYHFLTTIDFPRGELVLRSRSQETLQRFTQIAKKQEQVIVPFWMAGDHFMVAWGTVNRSQPMLFFVDTGLAGGGFSCSDSTLKEAGIQLQESSAFEGVGGGGKLRVIPFIVDELTLGKASEKTIHGRYMGIFPLESSLGFRVGGIISHEFFRPYALTMDFRGMNYYLKRTGTLA